MNGNVFWSYSKPNVEFVLFCVVSVLSFKDNSCISFIITHFILNYISYLFCRIIIIMIIMGIHVLHIDIVIALSIFEYDSFHLSFYPSICLFILFVYDNFITWPIVIIIMNKLGKKDKCGQSSNHMLVDLYLKFKRLIHEW